ncbi:MAG: hypothetical protein A2103_01545 [Gammaproteobacteria bacterium GWF2_41_13]|nr:MAG: hypothetical protein A2103_01545 [Gammaproteobacteria bacterium GWF2_41_13]
MKFSYTVDGQQLFQSIHLTIEPGRSYLITGTEDNKTTLLGGILAKILPVEAVSDVSAIQSLIKNYTGRLTLESEAPLPQTTVYVSTDPDRHLLFSTIEEEIRVQLAGWQKNRLINFNEILSVFSLDGSFLERRIATLSGGEKMKVALSIALSQSVDCYVFQGVIPWLDQTGRMQLLQQVQVILQRGSSVIFIEQETSALLPHMKTIIEFDGRSLQEIQADVFLKNQYTYFEEEQKTPIFNAFSATSPPALVLHQITLSQHPFSEIPRTGSPLLQAISLSLLRHRAYCIVGDNGSGKSTLIQLIFRVFKPKQGHILLQQRELSQYTRQKLNELICYVGQFPGRQLTLSTIGQYRQAMKKSHRSFSLSLMAHYLNLPDDFPLAALSFLQMKILCLLMALSEETILLILDEPTWGIDQSGRRVILQLIREIAQKIDMALLIVSHDDSFARACRAKILRLKNGTLTSC